MFQIWHQRTISCLPFYFSCLSSPLSGLLSLISCLTSHVSGHLSCLMSPVSCFLSCLMSPVSYSCFPPSISHLLPQFSCLLSPVLHSLSHVSCLMSTVSSLLPPISCLTSPVSCFVSCLMPPVLSHLFCIVSPVSCILSSISWLLSHVSCLMSPVSPFLSHVSWLTSHVSHHLSQISCFNPRLLFYISCHHCCVFIYCVCKKMPLWQMHKDPNTFASVQLWRGGSDIIVGMKLKASNFMGWADWCKGVSYWWLPHTAEGGWPTPYVPTQILCGGGLFPSSDTLPSSESQPRLRKERHQHASLGSHLLRPLLHTARRAKGVHAGGGLLPQESDGGTSQTSHQSASGGSCYPCKMGEA